MKWKLLALLAYGAYEYDKKQVNAGKPSLFSSLRNLTGTSDKTANLPANAPTYKKSAY